MRKYIYLGSIITLFLLTYSSCCKRHQGIISDQKPGMQTKAGPPVYIYKTRADYSKLVPLILSRDKKSILSYPAVSDVFYQGELAYPSVLAGGYLLDNRGISIDAAFLSFTYEEYSKLAKTPAPAELMEKILDFDPFTELYYCGSRYQYRDLQAELNQLIENKDFSKFRKEK